MKKTWGTKETKLGSSHRPNGSTNHTHESKVSKSIKEDIFDYNSDDGDPGGGWSKVDPDDPVSCHRYFLATGMQFGKVHKIKTPPADRNSHPKPRIKERWELKNSELDDTESELDEETWKKHQKHFQAWFQAREIEEEKEEDRLTLSNKEGASTNLIKEGRSLIKCPDPITV